MKWIKLKLNSLEIKQNDEIRGKITIDYKNKYDGVIINTQIFDSNEFIEYLTCNSKRISKRISSRLFINYNSIISNVITFTATIKFTPNIPHHDIKFRVCIIEQHKEIGEDVIWARYS